MLKATWILSLISLSASAAPVFDGITPQQHFQVGILQSGVSNAYDGLDCSLGAAQVTASQFSTTTHALALNMDARYTRSPYDPVLGSWIAGLRWILRPFAQDPLLREHRVCVGVIDGLKNVVSLKEGYIFADLDFFAYLTKLREGGALSALVVSAIFTHEFGHQLQFWTGQRFSPDGTAKEVELAADCISGALIGFGNFDSMPFLIRDLGVNEIVDFGKLLGDHDANAADHHGTPDERASAYRLGLDYASDYRHAHGPSEFPSLKKITNYCTLAAFGIDYLNSKTQ